MGNYGKLLLAGAMCCVLGPQVPAAEAARAQETVIYAFTGGLHGDSPDAGVIDVRGTLYGTTVDGGATYDGTLFSVDAHTGAEKVLVNFGSDFAGDVPSGGVIDVNGILYGTSSGGGNTDNGTVYSFDPKTGVATILHTFRDLTNGAYPLGGLVYANGLLFGTTFAGGAVRCNRTARAPGCGTVFSVDPGTGAETAVYAFRGKGDGHGPSASLLNVNGTLYGTTAYGGEPGGGGTVFSFDPATGREKVLWRFCSQPKCADGARPAASLIPVNGTLYGTTSYGGDDAMCKGEGCGTVFSLDPGTGSERTLYTFCTSGSDCRDGAEPFANLIYFHGKLYGTTAWGGPNDAGEIFTIDPATSAFKVIHSFGSGPDGGYPYAGLLDVHGTLYGTTAFGGAGDPHNPGAGCCAGAGTVFALEKP
jgi:uncharacterized repeat protein (TIGR03803 family)